MAKSYRSKLPDGVYYNRTTRQYKYDELAKAEAWANRFPWKMDDHRKEKLETIRWRFQMASDYIVKEGIGFDNWFKYRDEFPYVDWQTVIAAMDRLKRMGYYDELKKLPTGEKPPQPVFSQKLEIEELVVDDLFNVTEQ